MKKGYDPKPNWGIDRSLHARWLWNARRGPNPPEFRYKAFRKAYFKARRGQEPPNPRHGSFAAMWALGDPDIRARVAGSPRKTKSVERRRGVRLIPAARSANIGSFKTRKGQYVKGKGGRFVGSN